MTPVASGFKYRLQLLLDGRIQLKQEAEQRLAARQRELRTERERLEELDAEVGRVAKVKSEFRARLLSGTEAAVSGRDAAISRDYLRGLDQDLETARDACFSQRLVLEEAEERLSAARRELAECTREVEILEKHKARLEQRFVRELARKEAIEQDEIGNMLFMNRSRAR